MKPEITKKMSTPRKPPGRKEARPWNSRTASTARARRPSRPGREGSEPCLGAPMMLGAILLLLMIQLHSMKKMALVLLTAPLGMIGVSVVLALFRVPFGFVAMLGTIALGGMIMRNSVILIDQVRTEMEEGRDAWNAIVDAALHRTRPVVLTAAATVLAMLPLTRSVFWGPMALAIMGGLTIATVLTIFFVPALYAAWFKVRRAPAGGTDPVAGHVALAS